MTPSVPAGELVDTIVAAATAAGQGQRAMVRFSGPEAVPLALGLLTVSRTPAPGRPGQGWWELDTVSHSRASGRDGAAGEQVVGVVGSAWPADGSAPAGMSAPLPVGLLLFRGPRSFTGEDVVELHLPGWPVLVTEILRRAVAAGARSAARGEFLRRALIHGRIDLQQALAVGRLASSRDESEARALASQLSGKTERLGRALRNELLDTLALLEAHVDFEEQDTEAIGEQQLRDGLLRAADLARQLRDGGLVRPAADGETDVVLLGPPNAGKSALFLALCPGARTSVSPQPGTTRDALTATVERGGRRWRLIDGPGVGEVGNALDALAAERFLEFLPVAAIVLHVESVPTTSGVPGVADRDSAEGHRRRRLEAVGERLLIPVASRCDLLADPARRPAGLCTSAVTGEGLEELWSALLERAPTARAADLSERTEAEAAAAVLPLLEASLAGDLHGALPLLSLQLHEALECLEHDREDPLDVSSEVLDRIFAGFCIGK